MSQLATRARGDIDDYDGGGNGREHGASTEVAMTRAAQEVRAAMLIAKQFPRDETRAYAKILDACKRPRLAESSLYSYPKGNTTVEGPSIRLAEVLCQYWGNVESGVIELDRRDGVSTAMAYCWDLETNRREVKVFEVRHIRDKRGGGVKLTDERDIYELIANMGARRKRACILGVVPGDFVDAAVEECNKTLHNQGDGPIIDRIRRMVTAFADFQVTPEMIEQRLGHKLDVTSESEMVTLKKIFRSLKDNMGSREDYFQVKQESGLSKKMKDADAQNDAPAQTQANDQGTAKDPQEVINEAAAKTRAGLQNVAADDMNERERKELEAKKSELPAKSEGQDNAGDIDGDDLSTWESTFALMLKAAREHKIDDEDFRKRVDKHLKPLGMSEDPSQTSPSLRAALLTAFRNNNVDEKGKIKQVAGEMFKK